MRNFILSATIFIIVVSWSIGYFSYYHNTLHPKTLTQYTLTNGDKTLVFQEMIHIGSENFYNSVAEEIKKYKQGGFVYYFEWVKAWTQENNNKFNQALWVEFDETLYDNMSKLYWLIPQNNLLFLWLVNDQDYNVDTSIDEIIKKYEDIKTEKNIKKQYNSPVDLSWETVKMLAELEGRELQILVYVNQAILAAMTKNETIMTEIQNTFWNQELFEVILDKRNEIIADEIIHSPHTEIFATYWALHFKWIFEILQKNDSNWKIVSEKQFLPFQ